MDGGTLILGVGGIGVLVLRHLKHILLGCDRELFDSYALLGLDLKRSGDQELSDNPLPVLESQEFLQVASEDVRSMLPNLAAWRKELDWLPDWEGAQTLDEVAITSAGDYRWYGRLTFQRAEAIINRRVKDAFRSLGATTRHFIHERPGRVLLISSLAGGTGSAVLSDLAYLVSELAEETIQEGFLMLPGVSRLQQERRAAANAYAALRELFYWKGRGGQLQPGLMKNRQGVAGDLVKRLFLFEPETTEDYPFFATIERMAQAVAAQLHHRLRDQVLRVVERDFLLVRPDAEELRRGERCFSACGAAWVYSRPPEPRPEQESRNHNGSGTYIKPEETNKFLEVVARSQPSAGDEAKDGTRDTCAKLFRDYIDKTVDELARDIIERSAKTVATILNRYKQERKRQCGSTNRELRLLEDILEKPVDNEGIKSVRSRVRLLANDFAAVWRALKKKEGGMAVSNPTGAMIKTDRHGLEKWEGFEFCRERLKLGTSELLETLRAPSVTNCDFGAMKRFLESANEPEATQKERLESPEPGNIGGSESYQRELGETYSNWLRVLKESERLFRVHGDPASQVAKIRFWIPLNDAHRNIKERCSALQSLFESPQFEISLKKVLSDYARESLRDKLTSEVNSGIAGKEPAPPISEAEAGTGKTRETFASKDECSWQDTFRAAVNRCKQTVFQAAKPLAKSNAFAVLLIPKDWIQEDGEEPKRPFMKRIVDEVLQCRCQAVESSDDKIWIYYEDLFHSPCDLRHLFDYRRAYLTESKKEMLHIDGRLLGDPRFVEPCEEFDDSGCNGRVLCGNSGCGGNVADLPRTTRLCPHCHRPIRSRCGNPDCRANDLHLRSDEKAKTCPACNGFNHSAWWLCHLHGKIEILVAIDKPICPECIRRHQEDPVRYPESSLGRRPGSESMVLCPCCILRAKNEPSHEIFLVPEDLLPFYYHGVNGHDREKLAEIASKHKMRDGVRCPNCDTVLIPIHQPKVQEAS